MTRVTNSLPAKLDQNLQDFAQMTGQIDYSCIMNIGDKWNTLTPDERKHLSRLASSAMTKVRNALEETGDTNARSSMLFDTPVVRLADTAKLCAAMRSRPDRLAFLLTMHGIQFRRKRSTFTHGDDSVKFSRDFGQFIDPNDSESTSNMDEYEVVNWWAPNGKRYYY